MKQDGKTKPTNITLGFKPELVDGVLWDETPTGNGIKLFTNYSMGVDLGSPKEITRLRFYLNVTNGHSNLYWRNNDGWYIYKSDDNINWELCYVLSNGSPLINIQHNPWEFFCEFFDPLMRIEKIIKWY